VRKRRLLVTDPGWLQIEPTLRASVQVIDLKANGITSWGTLPFQNDLSYFPASDWYGGTNTITLGLPSLTCDERQMELTRWPSPSAVDQPWTFEYVASPATDNSYFSNADIPAWSDANWTGDNYVAVNMYPGWDNEAQDYYSAATISGTTVNLVSPVPPYSATPPYSVYYPASGNMLQSDVRFAIQNVLEMLLVPGQFYIDVNNFLIYFIPPDSLPDHAYRVTWTTAPLVQFYADETVACSGSSFTGGPLIASGCRGHGMETASISYSQGGPAPANLSFANLQAFAVGAHGFNFQIQAGAGPPANWSVDTLVVDWCGACGLWLGPSDGTGGGSVVPYTAFPTLDPWNSTFGEVFLGRTSQWCRSILGGAHLNCVGCTFGLIVSFQNPNHHLVHDSHDLVVNGGYFDGTFTEGGDVGIIYTAEDPTIFGTEFNNITFINIPNMTDGMRGSGVFTARRGLYIDNWGSGVTARNITCIQCNSLFEGSPDFCVFIHGGQACTIDGVQTISCAARPVGVMSLSGAPWMSPDGVAWKFIASANVADGRYQGKYGVPWAQLLTSTPVAGLPINNSVLRVYPDINSASQPDLRGSIFGLGCPINQPQGYVAPGSAPPFPPPLN
jgi:hypothetical protein